MRRRRNRVVSAPWTRPLPPWRVFKGGMWIPACRYMPDGCKGTPCDAGPEGHRGPHHFKRLPLHADEHRHVSVKDLIATIKTTLDKPYTLEEVATINAAWRAPHPPMPWEE